MEVTDNNIETERNESVSEDCILTMLKNISEDESKKNIFRCMRSL